MYLAGYTALMSLDALIILAGALVALLPFLGFPNSWDEIIFFVLGLFVISLGVVVRRRRPSQFMKRPFTKKSRPAYAQSDPIPAQTSFAHEEVAQQ